MGNVERWRLIVERGRPGAANMAVDEALMRCAAGAACSHTLRLFWFEPPTLSLGAFQPLPEADMGACAAAGIDLVRRPTGGRAVLHDGCITYSVTGPADGPVFGGGIRPSYRRIAAALVQAIAILGLREVVPIEPGANAPASPSCFDHAAPYEPVAAGVKLAGSAQARRGQAALQHGSLRLAPGRVPIAALLRPRAGGRGALPGADPPSLGELLGRDVSRDEAARALLAGFEATFGVAFIAGCLSADEQALAARLEQEKYRTPEWTARH